MTSDKYTLNDKNDVYSPSFEYPVASCRKENFDEFRFDTPQLAAESFINIEF